MSDFLFRVVKQSLSIYYVCSCWFDNFITVLIYFYAPVGCLFLANTGLFTNCIWRMGAYHTGQPRSNFKKLLRRHSKDRGIENGRMRLLLQLKLFAVMGLSWLFEVISWVLTLVLTNSPSIPDSSSTCMPWYLWTDLINALQGVWMLLIYVCKRDVWEKLRTRLL